MARYQVILSYDGAPFQGFQRQARAVTVQGVVEAALRDLGWEGTSILAAGRTDTGVHALGQVIAFDLEWNHNPNALVAALNAHLPPEVAAQSAARVPDSFHPRYAALSRRYRYRLYCQENRDPLRERYAWRVWPPVDGERMKIAAEALIGTYDFASFGTSPRAGGSTVRTVYEAGWQADEPAGLVFEISANAFLYRMVRRLVYFQVKIGQGCLTPESLVEHLTRPTAHPLQGLAPPNGLVLVSVSYPKRVMERSTGAAGEELDEGKPGN